MLFKNVAATKTKNPSSEMNEADAEHCALEAEGDDLNPFSKKKLKKAHQRNLIKRRVREAYRQNKSLFSFQRHWLIAYIYSSEDILSYKEIEDKLKDSLLRLSKTEDNSKT